MNDDKTKPELDKTLINKVAKSFIEIPAENFRFKTQYSISSWIFASSVAFLYAFLTEPIKMMSFYGRDRFCLSLILFIFCVYLGIKKFLSKVFTDAYSSKEFLSGLNELANSKDFQEIIALENSKKLKDSSKRTQAILGKAFSHAKGIIFMVAYFSLAILILVIKIFKFAINS